MTDQTNIEAIYTEHARELTGYARQLVPRYDRATAQDAVHETFTNFIERVRSGKVIENPRAYLFRSLRNVITSALYRGPQNNDVDSLPDMSIVSAPRRFRAHYEADLQQRLAVFKVGITAIESRKHREAFVRKRIYGESAAEIAKAMAISPEAAMNYASLGWKSLKCYVEQHGFSADDFFEDAA